MKNMINLTSNSLISPLRLPTNIFTKTLSLFFAILCGLTLFISLNKHSQAAAIDLIDYGINIDGTRIFPLTDDALPNDVDTNDFDKNTGLGTINVAISGKGSHFVGAFVDHEIDETINTFFNEIGQAVGVTGVGQSWEIDEPGFFTGDIVDNFENSSALNGTLLDQKIGAGVFGTTIFPDDISMAMGWEFSLAGGETANIDFILGQTMLSGFHLAHNDPDSDTTIYFSSTLDIQGTLQPSPIPEPSTIFLAGFGLIGIFLRQWNKNFGMQ